MKSVALYARVSSERQAQQATIESQVSALRERAIADGHRILPGDLYVDDGVSGTTLVRPGLERLRDRIAEGAVDVVYVHNPDRLARRYAYQVLLLEEFASHGVTVVFLQGGSAGNNAEDALLVQVQGMIAEYERAKLMERYRRGKLHKVRQGSVNPLACAPYGYTYVRRTETEPARFEILLPEAKVVRRVFDAFVHKQESIGEITRALNADHIPTRKGASCWNRGTVWVMLRNPAYIGQAAYGKSETVERGRLLRPLRGRTSISGRRSPRRKRPSEQWLHVRVPAIVSPEIFAAAGSQLERNRKLSRRNARGERYLLQGLVVCARCGYAFYGKTTSQGSAKDRKRYAYFRCVGTDAYRFAGGRVCTNAQVRVDQLDDYVWGSVRQVLEDPDRVLQEWSRRTTKDRGYTAQRAQYDEAVAVLASHERSLKRLVDAYEAGALELDDLTERSKRLKKRIQSAREDVKKAEARLTAAATLRSVSGRLQDFANRVKHGLDKLTWDERRRLIRMLVERIEIDEEIVTVVYRLPPSAPSSTGSGGERSGSPGGDPGSAGCHLRQGRVQGRVLEDAPRSRPPP